MKHPDFGMFILIIGLIYGLSNLFVYHFFGKMATESYRKMSDCLYECNWQDLTLKHQKHMIIMITNAQGPMRYDGFGMVLNLETFTKVRNRRNLSLMNYYAFCQIN